MATTTNYGWTTPDDTALVKDGAAAIRTLGSSVDTTTKALNPSTTLGDLEYRSSTANTNTRLGIGTSGQVLTVSGGVPSWSTPAASGFVGCKIKMTSTQSMSNNTKTTIAFPAEDFDTSSFHDNSSNNSRITIPVGKAGYYLVIGKIHWRGAAGSNLRDVYLMKNGSDVETTSFGNVATTAADTAINCQTIVNCAEGDYIELAGYQSSGGALVYFSATTSTTLQVQFLGA
jgi:hypothetical protein